MTEGGLQLTLESGQYLPTQLCWRVTQGYLRATGKTDMAETFTLGIWGPGEIVIPTLLSCTKPLELRALAMARVQEHHPDQEDLNGCFENQVQQLSMLLQLSHIRPVDARLLILLIWLSDRFGFDTLQGRCLPLEAMNLTHRQLAEMASVSRVTVTKSLGNFRQQGLLQRDGELEVVSRDSLNLIKGLP